MNILNISYTNTTPPITGGQIRIHGFNYALSQHSDNKVIQFSFIPTFFCKNRLHKYNDGKYIEFISSSFLYTSAIVVIWPILRIRSWFFSIPYVFKFIRPSKRLKQYMEWADIVQVDFPYLVSWAKKHCKKPIILAQHNVECDLAKLVINDRSRFLPSKLKSAIFKSVQKTERSAIKSSKYVFYVSKDDKEKMIDYYEPDISKFVLAPNGVRLDDYTPVTSELRIKARKKLELPKDSKIAIFTGSFHPPNVIAANFIEEELAPAFDNNIIFVIAGSVSNKYKRLRNIIYTGPLSMEEMRTYLKSANIAINPMSYGSGSNIKMFEYLACGLPIVSTPNGAIGLKKIEDNKALIVSELELFSQSVSDMFTLCDSNLNISSSALDLGKFHDYKYITGRIMEFYNKAIVC